MRILRLLFSATMFFVIIVVASFFIAREALLYLGSSQLQSSFRTLTLSKNRGQFASQCRQLGSVGVGGDGIVKYQLRFLSSNDYLLEAVCNQFSFDPILIEQVSLPEFVSKVPGGSGFVLDSLDGGIEIQVFAQELEKISEVVGFDLSGLVKTVSLTSEDGKSIVEGDINSISGSPVTSCNGYGYECCQDVSQVGIGSRITGLVDCEKTCYSSCATRPIVLSFNTNPIFDPKERTLYTSDEQTVEFTYVADAGKASTVGGVIDFGDGKKMPVSGLAGQVSHTYSCPWGGCEYYVTLTLEDNWGIESADTNIGKIKIVIGN